MTPDLSYDLKGESKRRAKIINRTEKKREEKEKRSHSDKLMVVKFILLATKRPNVLILVFTTGLIHEYWYIYSYV